MNTANPTKRIIDNIGNLIKKGALDFSHCCMISTDRYNACFDDVAIAVTRRIDTADNFFVVHEL